MYVLPHVFQHYTNTITRNYHLSPLTSSLQSQSQLRHTNTHIKDELEDEHSHNQITQEKEQETEENSFLVKNKNISELRKFKTTTSKKKPKYTWHHQKITL